MGIVEMPPQIMLVCDECESEPGSEEFGGYFMYDASDPDKALDDAMFHRLDDGRIVCDDCAFQLKKDLAEPGRG